MVIEKNAINRVSSLLDSSGYQFDQQVAIAGFRVDFLIYTPQELTIAIEVKAWKKEPGFRSRAAKYAELLAEQIEVDAVLLVLATLSRSNYNAGVVTLDALPGALERTVERRLSMRRQRPPQVQGQPSQVFAAMPFDQKYDDVYFVAMVHAAEQVRSTCIRVDQEEFTGDIVDEIHRLIRQSQAVIADLSEAQPNVLYEAGFAQALGKPTIHISSSPLSDLPFDVSHQNTLAYSLGRTHALREPLTARLTAALSGR